MFDRPEYLDILRRYRNTNCVKILTGIRRCGKSSLLHLWKQELLNTGVSSDHIIEARYTSELFAPISSHQAMYHAIRKQMTDDQCYYLLLDEVQEIAQWEKAINSLFEDTNCDIYVTGSNSKLLASEISSYLSGRYVSIPVYVLSFAEYLSFKNLPLSQARLALPEYLRTGGFPLVANNNFDEHTAYQIIEGICHSVISKDITQRFNINNFALFERVVDYVFENVGKTFSAHSISKFLKGQNRSVSSETIYNYLSYLQKAFIIYRCPRYDLQGKAVLKTQEKFFLADSGLKYSRLGFNPKSVAAMLENLVFLELLRRGCRVYVGKQDTKEIDFVATKGEDVFYIQVCRNMPEDSDRELGNLLAIKDNHPKFLVTLDDLATGDVEGVKICHLADFLLSSFI